MAENLSACRFDEETVWPDNEYLPEDFDSKYSSDLSSLQDEDDYQQSECNHSSGRAYCAGGGERCRKVHDNEYDDRIYRLHIGTDPDQRA